jgi:homoisocitrate dehydrogenase
MRRRYRIGVIPGDGIGQEVIPAAEKVLRATGVPLEFVPLEAGWGTFQQQGTALPGDTLVALKECDGAIFGAVSSPSHRVEGYTSPIVALRKSLNLYANLRPVAADPVPESRPDIDLLIVRENTECLYVKRERWEIEGEAAIAERLITRKASARITRVALAHARQRSLANGKQPRMTIVHKANVLSLTDGLFREAAFEAAREFADVMVDEQIVDSMLYHLIRTPGRYDTIVAPNLYGDLLSDAAAALAGGLGLMASANVGDGFILAEPVHGSAPDIAEKGVANPVAAVRAAGMLLAYLGEALAAQRIFDAVEVVLADEVWTPDLGGNATTDEVTAAILQELGRNSI